eukprot:6111823-Amphidinium_carterae.4
MLRHSALEDHQLTQQRDAAPQAKGRDAPKPGTLAFVAPPSLQGGGDTPGIGKLLAALKAVDCRYTAAQARALLGSKRLVEACLQPDVAKRKAVLEQEA